MFTLPHWNIVGPPGCGKTTLFELLTQEFQVETIPRVTTRKRRPGEHQGLEYIFAEESSYDHWLEHGIILDWTSRVKTNYGSSPIVRYRRGILAPKHWPVPKLGTQLVVSSFGSSFSLKIKELYNPGMINIYLRTQENEAIKRVEKRDGPGASMQERLTTIHAQEWRRMWEDFDVVIDTTSLTPREVLLEIANRVYHHSVSP